MKEIIQLGLIGFGKETAEQKAVVAMVDEEAVQKNKEREARVRVIPKGTVLYLSSQPEIAYTVVEPFYILRQKNLAQGKTLENVWIDSEMATVYRDGKRFEWGRGTMIQVHKKNMIRKK